MKLLPLPMFGRIFIALLVMTISALILIAATFSDYQERVTALTLAPMWAAAVRTEQEQPGAPRRELDLRMRIDVLSGCATAAGVFDCVGSPHDCADRCARAIRNQRDRYEARRYVGACL